MFAKTGVKRISATPVTCGRTGATSVVRGSARFTWLPKFLVRHNSLSNKMDIPTTLCTRYDADNYTILGHGATRVYYGDKVREAIAREDERLGITWLVCFAKGLYKRGLQMCRRRMKLLECKIPRTEMPWKSHPQLGEPLSLWLDRLKAFCPPLEIQEAWTMGTEGDNNCTIVVLCQISFTDQFTLVLPLDIMQKYEDEYETIFSVGYAWGEALEQIERPYRKVINISAPLSLRICAYCGAVPLETPLQRCGACLWIRYCDKDCQRKDWQQHKPQCLYVREINAKSSESEEELQVD